MLPLIQIDDLTKTYVVGDVKVHALRKVSLEIRAGEFVTIVGPSGSGKSTFMHILGCLDKPTSGGYVLERPRRLEAVERRAGARAQLHDRVRVSELQPAAADVGDRERGAAAALQRQQMLGGRAPKQKAMTALAAVGLADRAHHHPNQLSGGQQQRVAIARALMTEPPVLLADEPTGNLDTRTSIEVMEIFQQLQRDRGITVIVITHEHQIAEYGTRIISFRDGRIVSDAPNTHVAPGERGTGTAAGAGHRGRVVTGRETFELATKTLRRNPLRSALTLRRHHDRRGRRRHDGGRRQRRARVDRGAGDCRRHERHHGRGRQLQDEG